MPKRSTPSIDPHTKAAMQVAAHQYFVIADVSYNEAPGLLVGTEVEKYSNPESRESKYWKNAPYWSTVVLCPNGETRRVCCDALKPRKTNKYFGRQVRMFGTPV